MTNNEQVSLAFNKIKQSLEQVKHSEYYKNT